MNNLRNYPSYWNAPGLWPCGAVTKLYGRKFYSSRTEANFNCPISDFYIIGLENKRLSAKANVHGRSGLSQRSKIATLFVRKCETYLKVLHNMYRSKEFIISKWQWKVQIIGSRLGRIWPSFPASAENDAQSIGAWVGNGTEAQISGIRRSDKG